MRDFHKKQAVKYNSEINWSKCRENRNNVNLEFRFVEKDYFCDEIRLNAQSNDACGENY